MNTQPPDHPPNAPDPLAVSLAKLDPTPHGFDWNALMFAAGRESKARALLFWRVTAGVCALVACGFAFVCFTRPPVSVPAERIVYVERLVPAPAPAPVAPAIQPAPVTEVKPEPLPATPSTLPSPVWSFDPPPEQSAAARWVTLRNEVLTVGLGVLPDTGTKAPGPRIEK